MTLRRAPAIDGRTLLARYNLELARGVLLDADRLTVRAGGGWRAIFRALKAGRVMYEVRRRGRSYEVEVTGPATAFIVRRSRYGTRLARVIPALMRAPRWRFEADVTLPNGSRAVFRAQGRPRAAGRRAPVGGLPRRPNYDSAFERSLASDFRRGFGKEPRNEWTLSRESSPVAVGTELFLPDFTFRHADGREALVEIVGFWTPEYLAEKVRKVTAAKLDSLVLVVYRGLAVGGATAALEAAAGANRIVWFANKPRAPEVLEAVERWAVAPRGRNE